MATPTPPPKDSCDPTWQICADAASNSTVPAANATDSSTKPVPEKWTPPVFKTTPLEMIWGAV